jgi:hypothetical protein
VSEGIWDACDVLLRLKVLAHILLHVPERIDWK